MSPRPAWLSERELLNEKPVPERDSGQGPARVSDCFAVQSCLHDEPCRANRHRASPMQADIYSSRGLGAAQKYARNYYNRLRRSRDTPLRAGSFIATCGAYFDL